MRPSKTENTAEKTLATRLSLRLYRLEIIMYVLGYHKAVVLQECTSHELKSEGQRGSTLASRN